MPIPEEMIPADSRYKIKTAVVIVYMLTMLLCYRVEIDAKIASGYFTSGKAMTEEQLAQVKGRNWEDIEH